MLRRAMKPLSEDQVELIVAAVLGAALFGILIGYSLENGWFGIIIWALIGAVVVSGALFIVFGLFASASLAASRSSEGLFRRPHQFRRALGCDQSSNCKEDQFAYVTRIRHVQAVDRIVEKKGCD